jgi:hypothetical protein
MSEEIAEFLRRAAQRRAEQAQQQLDMQRRAAGHPQPPPFAGSRPGAASSSFSPVVEAEVIDEAPILLRPAESRLSQQVSRHLDNKGFEVRADRFAEATEQADERMEEHLHLAFDHRLGSIGPSAGSISAAVGPVVDSEMKGRVVDHHPVLSLLREPQGIRNAVILGELLKRPEHLW